MDELLIVRRMLRRAVRGLPASHSLARELLEWGRNHGTWLLGLKPAQAKKLTWSALKRGLQKDPACADRPGVIALADELSRLLQLDPTDSAIVAVAFGFDRLRLPGEVLDMLARHQIALHSLIGEVAGLESQDADRRVRLNLLFRLRMIEVKLDWRGAAYISLGWTLEKLLDRLPGSAEEIVAMLVGPPQVAGLDLGAFAHVEAADFLRRLLEGARRERAAGVNILFHGPPGTGKTELARSLAAAAGLTLHGVGEADDDGGEPTRWDRMVALQMGLRLLGGDERAALLFDEMEDMTSAQQGKDSDSNGRDGSKVYFNRLLETNPVPVIWTTNDIERVDPAVLRRMSYILHLDHPPRAAALRMLEHVAQAEGVTPTAELARLVERAPETSSVLRVAARGARLAGETDGGMRPAAALVRALRSGQMPHEGPGPVDFGLYEGDVALEPLFERIRASEHADVSLLLTGPPGTGKTALAHHFARVLDRPLLVRRTSDLLSKWVGETEAAIAEAFERARTDGAVLLFDEADSLLFDRTTARASWEVSQVNEMLTWLDSHPLPVIAATNHAGRLDPATLRRFVFKLDLRPLEPARAARAFTRFFEMEAPASLAGVRNLTPGDFAVVARQLRHAPKGSAEAIVARLKAEAACKPGAPGRIGF